MDDNPIDQSADEYNPLNEPPRITFDIARHFHPLRGQTSRIWESSLSRIREQFASIVDHESQLVFVLTHSATPDWPKRLGEPSPAEISGLRSVAMGAGPGREPEQLFIHRDEEGEKIVYGVGRLFQEDWRLKILDIGQAVQYDGKTYETFAADIPVHDVTGRPILFSNDEPVAIRQGCHRFFIAYSDASATAYLKLASEAGRCLYGLPPAINRFLWSDWLVGFGEIDEQSLWTNALFELAWKHVPGSSLTARKFVWNENISVPLDAVPFLRGRSAGGFSDDWLKRLGEPPAHWFSTLVDPVSASMAAIDLLLSLQSAPIGKSTNDDDEIATGQSEAQKVSPIRAHVARAITDIDDEYLPQWLENADLVLSWHEADPPRPKNTKKRQALSRWIETVSGVESAEDFERLKSTDRQYRRRHGYCGKDKSPIESHRMQKKWVEVLKNEVQRRRL